MAASKGKGVREAAEAAVSLGLRRERTLAGCLKGKTPGGKEDGRQAGGAASQQVLKGKDADAVLPDEAAASMRYREVDRLVALTVRRNHKARNTTRQIDRILMNRLLGFPIFAALMWAVYMVSVNLVGGNSDRLASRKALSRPDWRESFGSAGSYGYGPMAAKPVDRRPAEGSRGCAQLSAANCRAVPDPLFAGGLRIYGPGSVPDGPAAEAAWTFRKIFYLIFSRHRVLCSRDYGQPDDRGSNQPAPDYFFNAVHPLQRQASPICFAGGAFFPDKTWVAPSMYFVGMGAAIFAGLLLKKWKPFHREASGFVMELPDYRLPNLKSVGRRVWERIKAFVVKAGTIIFIGCGILWFLQRFDRTLAVSQPSESILADLGRCLAPLFTPLGFGRWEAAVAALSGALAKENIVAALENSAAPGLELRQRTARRPGGFPPYLPR